MPNHNPRSWLGLLCFAAACGAGSQAPHATSESPAPAQSSDVSLQDSMRHHFEHATAARDAVIAGRLADVHAPLLALANQETSADVPNDWLPWLDEMKSTASKGAAAATL